MGKLLMILLTRPLLIVEDSVSTNANKMNYTQLIGCTICHTQDLPRVTLNFFCLMIYNLEKCLWVQLVLSLSECCPPFQWWSLLQSRHQFPPFCSSSVKYWWTYAGGSCMVCQSFGGGFGEGSCYAVIASLPFQSPWGGPSSRDIYPHAVHFYNIYV